MRDIDISIASRPQKCRVMVDGETVPAYRVEIVADVAEDATQIIVYARKYGEDPYVIKGRLVEDSE
jgi:hypothetical protein